MSLQVMAYSGDSWIREYNEGLKLADDITNMISERSSLPASGPEAQRHSSAIRRKITILGTRLDNLQSILSKLPGKQPLGFDVAREGTERLEVTHLQYADDTLIFCDAEEEQLKYLRVILVLFEGISGLHINWRKSMMYPINQVNNMSCLASILGREIGVLPTIYLGMPLGAKSKSIDIWNSVIEKCEKKLAKWKSQYLSKGGRPTLINSVLDALPTYMMSLFPIPPGVIKRLDRIRRNFLWQGNKEKKSFHLVKWEEVMTSKENGGLGIKNLKLQSKALSMKWLWKYANNNQMLWREVIGAKYEKEDNWITKEVTTPYGVSLWRSI
ncbi:hypothetical protein MTR67_033323 [Solanum verrucosum]|uniref:Uncharacterized protein n=1 Tax=Solanum verrucosum TaxID=315347 RepID=A0AAF0U5U4_SOLVR|nr:hypothetical protein MTR67_033323 [Solanum verrucosum]